MTPGHGSRILWGRLSSQLRPLTGPTVPTPIDAQILTPVLLIAGGLVVLIAGGELLVRGAVALAVAARVTPLVIGLTVVAFGTSAPEFAVTIDSSITGSTDLALGNVVGSNIGNTLLILGLCAVVTPLVVSSHVIRFYVPVMIGASFLLYLLGLDGVLGKMDGLVLFLGFVLYNLWSVRGSETEEAAVQEEFAGSTPRGKGTRRERLGHGALIAVGLGLLALGARWMVSGAVDVSRSLGISELVIGLTVVAVGTSLPEMATSLTATVRGQRDIAVGNVVGSNLFNILGVLGVACLIAPGGVLVSPSAQRLDIPFMIAAAAATLPVSFTGNRIGRREGAVFLGYYAAYIAYLVLETTRSDITRTLGVVMLGFIVPLTAMALLVSLVRWRRVRISRPPDGGE